MHVRVGAVDRTLIGAAGHRGRSRHQPDPAAVAARHRQLRGRPDNADDVDLTAVASQQGLDRGQRGRAGGVAGDHQQLGAGGQEVLGDLEREGLELALRALPVGEARRVAEVQVVLRRQRHEQFVQDGQPAHAGIEDRHGLIGNWRHAAGWCQR